MGNTFGTPTATPAPAGSVSYLTAGEADALASLLPGLSAWSAASEGDKTAALELATADVDAAGPYQGRRYDATQALEFPRVPYAASADLTRYAAGGAACETVWDWDADANEAVVPLKVKRAVLYQADSILSGISSALADRQQAISSGLASQSVGGMSESYRDPVTNGGRAGWTLLAVRAQAYLVGYRLRSGKLL